MRKRRRLANKMTIMVCAVLIAVSAFFYAPMEVEAEEVIFSSNVADINNSHYTNAVIGARGLNFIGSEFNNDDYYYFKVRFDVEVVTDSNILFIRNFSLRYAGRYLLVIPSFSDSSTMNFNETYEVTFCSKGSWLKNDGLTYDFRVLNGNTLLEDVKFDVKVDYEILDYSVLTGEQSETYQNGYNAGYSAGEQAGYGNGYSEGFADGVASVDTNDIYNQGFEAGKDSVDTQSYYDAGYQAGYQVAFQEGYDSGYDEGYQSAMDRIDGWGADSSDYPLKMSSFSSASQEITATVFTSVPSISFEREVLFDLNFDINPNHTYKYVVKAWGVGTGLYDASFSDYDLNLSIGSNTFDIPRSAFERSFYIPGYNMDSLTCLEMYVYDGVYYGGVSEEDGFLKHSGRVSAEIYDFFIDVYDMGPSGDTQNHIANQTDKLTNGFNDSKGNSVNSDFSAGLNDFETAEDSLFATATTGLKDFTFFDFQSVPAMVTGMSFVGSIMSGWFTQAGGASGVGIVLSILFSIMLVAMVLGLYRWYQSKGGKD